MGAEGFRHLPDRDLLHLIARNEPDALAAVYDRYIAPVWKLALLTSSSQASAEQAVQRAFGDLWRRPEPHAGDRLPVRLLANVKRLATPAAPGSGFRSQERRAGGQPAAALRLQRHGDEISGSDPSREDMDDGLV
jgi:hypothetical protein